MQLERFDLVVVGGNPWDDRSFDIGYYANTGAKVSDAALDALRADLQRTIEQIPGSRTLTTLQDP